MALVGLLIGKMLLLNGCASESGQCFVDHNIRDYYRIRSWQECWIARAMHDKINPGLIGCVDEKRVPDFFGYKRAAVQFSKGFHDALKQWEEWADRSPLHLFQDGTNYLGVAYVRGYAQGIRSCARTFGALHDYVDHWYDELSERERMYWQRPLYSLDLEAVLGKFDWADVELLAMAYHTLPAHDPAYLINPYVRQWKIYWESFAKTTMALRVKDILLRSETPSNVSVGMYPLKTIMNSEYPEIRAYLHGNRAALYEYYRGKDASMRQKAIWHMASREDILDMIMREWGTASCHGSQTDMQRKWHE